MAAQVIVGICSVVIALCALVFTMCQGRQARHHNKLSVRPHLNLWTYNKLPEEPIIMYEIANNGLGPAVIEDIVSRQLSCPV